VVEVARVVAHLVDVRRHLRHQPVVLLEIDDEVRRRALADFRESFGVLHVVAGDADEAGAGVP
jgi:hypothetical protein